MDIRHIRQVRPVRYPASRQFGFATRERDCHRELGRDRCARAQRGCIARSLTTRSDDDETVPKQASNRLHPAPVMTYGSAPAPDLRRRRASCAGSAGHPRRTGNSGQAGRGRKTSNGFSAADPKDAGILDVVRSTRRRFRSVPTSLARDAPRSRSEGAAMATAAGVATHRYLPPFQGWGAIFRRSTVEVRILSVAPRGPASIALPIWVQAQCRGDPHLPRLYSEVI